MFDARNRIAATAAILLFGLLLQASPTGAVRGVVTDASHSVIPNAAVTAIRQGTQERRSAIADSTGAYEFLQLAPGRWTLTFEAPKFKRVSVPDVVVEVDQVARVNTELPVGDRTETIEVHANTPLIEPDRATESSVIDQRTIAHLPLNGRQYLDLALLTPGVAATAPGTQGNGFVSSGIRSQSNMYALDGISNVDTQTGGPLNLLRITDAIQEFAVDTSATLPEFGRASGAQVNIVTKGGTDQFHGSAFEYLRNTVLNAADFFTNKLGGTKAAIVRNQYGGTLGGPIVRARTFFFSSYEGFRQESPTVTPTLVPTAAQRATVTDPISQKLLAFWPQPNTNSTTSNYIANVRNQNFDSTGLVRIDHRLDDKDQLSGRWTGYWGESFAGGATPIIGGNSGPFRQRSVMLDESHTFTPSLISDLRFGYSVSSENRVTQDNGFDASTLFTDSAGNPLPGVVHASANPQNSGLPQIVVGGGFAMLGTQMNFPQGRQTDTYELNYNMSWRSASGRHTLRWGWQVRREDMSRYLNRSERGTIMFASFANFAKGLLTSSTFRTGSTQTEWTRDPWSSYFQDEFRVTENFKITYGLRYELPSALAVSDHNAINFVPGYGPVVVGTSLLLNINPALTGASSIFYTSAPFTLPSSGVYPERDNFAPMFGFAYAPGSKTVIRGGYRIAYDELFNNVPASMALGPPQNLQTSQTANVTQPGPFAWSLAFNQNVPLVSNYNKQAPGTPTVGITTFQGIDPHFRNAYAHLYDLAIERAITRSLAVEVAYEGSAGHRLGMFIDVNQPTVSVKNPALRGTQAPNQQFFPYNSFGQSQVAKSIGNSDYNSGLLTVRYRHRRVFARGSYVVSKSMDYNSSYFGSGMLPGEPGAPIDSTRIYLEHGPSAFDVRQHFVAYYGADLPWGWNLSGITTIQTGTPFTVVTGGPDTSGLNQVNAGASPNPGNRPMLTNPAPLPQSNGNPDAAFNPAWFTTNLAGQDGTSGRNQYYGPGLANFDVSMAKSLRLPARLGEETRLIVRADFFNLFNHTNFALPDATLSDASFGKITQTLGSAVATQAGTTSGPMGGPRLIQFSLRVQF